MGIEVIGIWTVVVLIVLSAALIVLFGVISLTRGKVNTMTMIFRGLPLVVFVVLGFATGDWPRAGILTIALSLGALVVGLLWSSIKGIFN